jgi:hypothetical protein
MKMGGKDGRQMEMDQDRWQSVKLVVVELTVVVTPSVVA